MNSRRHSEAEAEPQSAHMLGTGQRDEATLRHGLEDTGQAAAAMVGYVKRADPPEAVEGGSDVQHQIAKDLKGLAARVDRSTLVVLADALADAWTCRYQSVVRSDRICLLMGDEEAEALAEHRTGCVQR